MFWFWVPYNCSKFGIQVGVKLFIVAAVVLMVLPAVVAGIGAVSAGFGLVTVLFVIPVIMLAKLLDLWPDKLLQQPSRQPGRQMAPSPILLVTPFPQQIVSSRQSQTQAMPPLHSLAASTPVAELPA